MTKGHIVHKLLPFLNVGDVVTHVATGDILYKIERVKQVKLIATQSASGRRIEGRIEHFKLAPNPTDFIDLLDNVLGADDAPKFAFGKAVRFKSAKRPDQRGVFIVLAENAAGWRLALLGGSQGNRYWRGIQPSQLEDVTEINDKDWTI